MTATMTTALADPGALGAWLDTQGIEPGRPLTVEPMAGGGSNAMFRVERGAGRWVLRRPARVAIDRADAGMLRESQILRALEGSDVPHPEVVAVCTDRCVLGCTFYLMRHVEGRPPIPVPAELDTPAGRRRIVFAVVDALARLHDFDWRGAGLAHLGHPEGFHERQVERWTRQLRAYGGRELPGVAVVAEWLGAHRPENFTPALMHGDYHMMNIIMTTGAPTVAAIVDWETATIGDPLLDLAGLCEAWTRHGGEGWPPAAELTEAYRAARGLGQLPSLRYYEVLYNFRLAVLLEGISQRAQRDPTRTAQPGLGELAVSHAERAAQLATDSPAGEP
jgi:aminoglycoside phosphotransferase (APT) family kinase protein